MRSPVRGGWIIHSDPGHLGPRPAGGRAELAERALVATAIGHGIKVRPRPAVTFRYGMRLDEKLGRSDVRFAQSTIETERGEITLVHGSGPLPALAERFTGGRSQSAGLPRAVAGDQVEMMAALGFDRFAVVGHERQQATGRAFACAHFLAEELPDDTVSELLAFLA